MLIVSINELNKELNLQLQELTLDQIEFFLKKLETSLVLLNELQQSIPLEKNTTSTLSTAKSAIFWQSKKTGFTSHGSVLTHEEAVSGARYGNASYPDIKHIVVDLTEAQAKLIARHPEQEKVILDQIRPFKASM